MNTRRFGTAIIALSLLTQAAQAAVYVKVADEWGTIQATGARTGANGVSFWNAEGVTQGGSFASTAPVRFKTDQLIQQFNTQFGVGNWHVNNVNFVFTQSNSAFTAPGDVNVYWF